MRENKHQGKIAILVGADEEGQGKTAEGPGAIRAEVGRSFEWRATGGSVQLDFHVTPFRAERFVDVYRPAVARPRSYGATGYSSTAPRTTRTTSCTSRSGTTAADFDRYWLSREMRDIRTQILGLHDHLLLPHYGSVLERA